MSVAENIHVCQETACLNKDFAVSELLCHLFGDRQEISRRTDVFKFSPEPSQAKPLSTISFIDNLRKVFKETITMYPLLGVGDNIHHPRHSHTESLTVANVFDEEAYPQGTETIQNSLRTSYLRRLNASDYESGLLFAFHQLNLSFSSIRTFMSSLSRSQSDYIIPAHQISLPAHVPSLSMYFLPRSVQNFLLAF